MSDDWLYRPARPEDVGPAYAVFRRAIYAYLGRIGLVTAEEAAAPPIDEAWRRQAGWVGHLWDTAAGNWVATDRAGRVCGWALSVERAGHLELAFFFVEPGAVAGGIGRRLLDHAFAARPESRRTIMATHDPAALSLYLRSGVRFVSTACDIGVTARPAARPPDPASGLTLRPLSDRAALAAVAAIEERLLGLDRAADLAFLARDRPCWLAFRDGAPAGYAFGARPERANAFECGPIGALAADDLPDLIDHVLAPVPEGQEVSFTVPLANHTAVAHLLALGGRIDPFYIAVLSSEALSLDRYVHTSPSFII